MFNLTSPSLQAHAKMLFSGARDAQEQREAANISTRLSSGIKDHYGSSFNMIQQAMVPDNLLGEGCQCIVYRIPQMDEFVLQVSKRAQPIPVNCALGDLNIGQPVAQIPTFQILRYQPGERTQVHHPALRVGSLDTFQLTDDARITAQYRQAYQNFLEKVADIPQSGYNQLAETLKTIAMVPGYHFDSSSNNILIDSEAGRFNVVDGIGSGLPTENLTGMLNALLDGMYVATDEQAVARNAHGLGLSVAQNEAMIALRKAILVKCLIAAFKTHLPVEEHVRPKSHPEAWWKEEYLFKICGLEGKWPAVYQIFQGSNKSIYTMSQTDFIRRLRTILDIAPEN